MTVIGALPWLALVAVALWVFFASTRRSKTLGDKAEDLARRRRT